MVDLTAKSPAEGLLPVSIGTQVLREVDLGVLTSVMAYRGKEKALLAAMQEAHGLAAPGPNRMTGRDGCRAIWFGRGQVLLAGPEPKSGLADVAALSTQSDAWTVVELSGPRAEAVLSRLVPIDLRLSVFGVGQTARSLIGHMNGSVSRLDDARFLLMVFRSMAATLVHEISDAMETVAARD